VLITNFDRETIWTSFKGEKTITFLFLEKVNVVFAAVIKNNLLSLTEYGFLKPGWLA